MAVGSKDSEEDNEKSVKKWNGSTIELDDFDKKIARWCRKQYGTIIGDYLWENSMPDLDGMRGSTWNEHCEVVWDAINDKDSHLAKGLWDVSSGFGIKNGMQNGGRSNMTSYSTKLRHP